ncbi:hypothetical protein [Bradyrhizobium sp. USDA 4518]
MAQKPARKLVPRGPNKPKEITEVRQLVCRKEAAKIIGCSVDVVKKLEKKGSLDVIKLYPTARNVFYRLEQVNRIVRNSRPNSTCAETSTSQQTG